MRILAVGGLSSGVGKTSMICRILPFLPGWGVLKTSVRSVRKGGYEILSDPEELYVPGKDTGRFHQAGAAALAWLRTGPEGLEEGVPEALLRFKNLDGVIVEGNSHVLHSPPDRIVLVARADLSEIKPTARLLLPKADLVVLNRRDGTSDSAMNRERLLDTGATCPILEADICTGRFVEQAGKLLATWFPLSV